jgi:hypothetical protein
MQVTVVFNLANEREAQAFDAAKAIVTGTEYVPMPQDAPKQTRPRKTAQPEPESPKQAEKQAEPTHTLEDVRKMVTDAQDEGVQKSEIKALLGEFGATKVPDLDTANYDEFATKLQKLVEDAI